MLSTNRIKQGFLNCTIVLLWALAAPAEAWSQDSPAFSPEDVIAGELEQTLQSLARLNGEKPANLVPLLAFYQNREYRPVWCSAAGVSPVAQRWLSILGSVEREGMSGLLLRRAEIQRQLNAEGPAELADLDLMLTDSFFQYARYMGRGQLDSSLADPYWHIPKPQIKPVALLEGLVQSGRFDDAVDTLSPRQRDYRKLREALIRYQTLHQSGGWPVVQPDGPQLEPGDSSEEIPALRQQLWLVGDLAQHKTQGYRYDRPLERAVIRFQQRHGLRGDGVIGKRTRAALAVPVEQRIEQIRLNLERWRWLPRELGSRYIIVNSAAFELQVHDEGDVPLSMRVVVGKKRHPTPVFTAKMRYLIVNPYWHVPTKVAVRDLIPKQVMDPDYFSSRSIRVLADWQPAAIELASDQIDWQAYLGGEYLPYKLRQDPGPGNALGRIKFMLPNRFSIYLHDTPGRHLFDKPVRTFSAGCVRLDKPMALANYVLGGKNQSSAQEVLESLIAQNETVSIPLPDPIPVYLLYQTAWVGADGRLQFRNDVYGHDARLTAALQQLIAPDRGSGYAVNLSAEIPVDLQRQPDPHSEKFKPVKTLVN